MRALPRKGLRSRWVAAAISLKLALSRGQQVIELATLHQRGELTDAEFEAAKKKLFS